MPAMVDAADDHAPGPVGPGGGGDLRLEVLDEDTRPRIFKLSPGRLKT